MEVRQRSWKWPDTDDEATELLQRTVKTVRSVHFWLLLIPLLIIPLAAVMWLVTVMFTQPFLPMMTAVVKAFGVVWILFGAYRLMDQPVYGLLEKVFKVPLTNRSLREITARYSHA